MTAIPPGPDVPMIENRIFAEIGIGEAAELTRTVSRDDVALFAALSGDYNPTHQGDGEDITAHSMLAATLFSNLLGTRLPGAGTVYVEQGLSFTATVHVGDVLTASITVTDKEETGHLVRLDCRCVNQRGQEVLAGRAVVRAPAEHQSWPMAARVHAQLDRHPHYDRLIARTASMRPIPCAVAHPCDDASLEGVLDAARHGIIAPILVGPSARITAVAAEHGFDLGGIELVDTPHSHASAATAVELVRTGKAQLLMKGSLHTDELMGAVVAKDTGLRTGRRISHVFIMDVSTYPVPLFITDAAINIAPDLPTKVDIIQNVIDLHHGLGLGVPRVAILSAVETVNPKLPGTLDAAALCKMADRGQITGGLLDGPLALDNAISPEAARIKGIRSEVAGQAQVLVVPDLEAGNMLAKNLSFLAGADAAGIVIGARVPIVLTSRADSARTRLASCAVAALYAEHLAGGGARP